ncbi:UNVERIFIED_CONTAM: hypothetical protein FKN15_070492 [Acipenser sinensis]
MNMMMPSKSVEWLQEELESGESSLLLLDCRSHELFESSHIDTAINLAIPGLMLRRLKKGNLPIRSIIPNNEDKEKFVKRCKTDTVVLYDEATSDWQENGAATSVLGLLLQKLRDDGCEAYYLDDTAINLAIPGLMLRRLKKGNLPIRSIIPNNEDKEKFVKRCKTDTVVLYDEATSDWQENGAATSVLGLLLQKLRDDGCEAYYLDGGFNKFQSEYSEHCETSLDTSCPSSSPPMPVLGLGGLRISSDCSDGESDREPSSATESEGSPLPSNQPL